MISWGFFATEDIQPYQREDSHTALGRLNEAKVLTFGGWETIRLRSLLHRPPIKPSSTQMIFALSHGL